MLSAMSHDQFDEWCAKDIIEPIGGVHQICEILAKIGQIISAFAGHEMKPEYFMPWTKKKRKQVQLTPKQSSAAVTQHIRMLAGVR